LNLLSSCIPGRKTISASQPGNSSSCRLKIFRRKKLNRVNPNLDVTSDTRSQVTHLSGKILSGSATTITTLLPYSISPLGGNIGGNPEAHSPGGSPEFVPSPAPSSSSELGSAAAAALSPQFFPSVHDIGGIERSEEMLDFDDWYSIACQLTRSGVPRSQVPLFKHLALEFKGTQGIVVA
jgi:hypothetical protein